MSRFIFFLTLGFVYLALLHVHSPLERQIIDVKDYEDLLKEVRSTDDFNENHPYSVILTDVYKEGVFIKTSYIKVKLVSPFHSYEFLTFKVSSNYFHYLKPYIGFEILHHAPNSDYPLNTVLPPGFSFVGNPILGYWKKKSGKKSWAFYRFYRNLYIDLAWDTPIGDYRPSVDSYRALRRLSIARNEYQIDYPKPENLKYTRERENIILFEGKLFGYQGFHTPYIAPSYMERINREQLSSLSNVFLNFYDVFFRPLQGKKL